MTYTHPMANWVSVSHWGRPLERPLLVPLQRPLLLPLQTTPSRDTCAATPHPVCKAYPGMLSCACVCVCERGCMRWAMRVHVLCTRVRPVCLSICLCVYILSRTRRASTDMSDMSAGRCLSKLQTCRTCRRVHSAANQSSISTCGAPRLSLAHTRLRCAISHAHVNTTHIAHPPHPPHTHHTYTYQKKLKISLCQNKINNAENGGETEAETKGQMTNEHTTHVHTIQEHRDKACGQQGTVEALFKNTYMYKSIYIYIYICIYVDMYIHVNVYLYVYTGRCIFARRNIYIHTYP